MFKLNATIKRQIYEIELAKTCQQYAMRVIEAVAVSLLLPQQWRIARQLTFRCGEISYLPIMDLRWYDLRNWILTESIVNREPYLVNWLRVGGDV